MSDSETAVPFRLREHLRARGLSLVLAVGLLLIALYFIGVIPTWAGAAAIAAIAVLGSCAYAVRGIAGSSPTPRDMTAGIAIAVVAVIAAAIPIGSTLFPGEPKVHAIVKGAGDTIPLPEVAHGPVRIRVEARVGGTGAANADVVFAVGGQHLETHFSRTPQTIRMGRRGRAQVMSEHNSAFLSADVPTDVAELRVEAVRGQLAGPVRVDIFDDLLPEKTELVIAFILILASAIVAARLGAGSGPSTAIGIALLFGVMFHHNGSPSIELQPEFGLLAVGAIGGVVSGTVLNWICTKLIRKRERIPTAA